MVWTNTAVRDLHQLEGQETLRVVSRLEHASVEPHHFFTKLVSSEEFKLRIGHYRLLALLALPERKIFVERVEHRTRVYRP